MLAILPLANGSALAGPPEPRWRILAINLARGVVLPEVVVRDHQVQLRLGVIRIQADRLFEIPFGLREIALGVRDHPEHVENIRETIGFGHNLSQQVLGFVELALLVMLPAQEEKLLDVVVHASGMEPRKARESTGGGASRGRFRGKSQFRP
jgi:hypothetical protein